MSAGVVRAVDSLGRISLPAAYMEWLTIGGGDSVEVFEHSGRIVLKPLAEHCVFCGSQADLRAFKNRYVCKACLDEVPYPPDRPE